jgi:hypothetical protein
MSASNLLRNLIVCAFVAGGVIIAVGCSTQENPKTNAAVAPAAPTTQLAAKPAKGRAQLWAENCMRCHNMRPPDWYSDAQWDLAMMQMRVRGYLTGEQQKQILEFLQSAN